MVELGDRLADLLRSGNKMVVKTLAGTDLASEIGDRPVYHNSGIISKPNEQSFLGGQVSWAPVEESINGRLVFDGSLWPPEEIGLLASPIELIVKKGKIMKVEGGSEAKVFEKWLESFDDPHMLKIAHFSYGFNPGAKLTGIILEDERVFGGVEIGIGSQRPQFKGKVGPAGAHTDGTMLNLTVLLDDSKIEEDGSFIYPDLKKLVDKLL